MTADVKTDWSAVSWNAILLCIANGRPGAVEAAEKRADAWRAGDFRGAVARKEIAEAQATWAKAQKENVR